MLEHVLFFFRCAFQAAPQVALSFLCVIMFAFCALLCIICFCELPMRLVCLQGPWCNCLLCVRSTLFFVRLPMWKGLLVLSIPCRYQHRGYCYVMSLLCFLLVIMCRRACACLGCASAWGHMGEDRNGSTQRTGNVQKG